MSSWAPAKYKTTNWSTYNEALPQRGSLTIWFDPERPAVEELVRHEVHRPHIVHGIGLGTP